MVQLNTCCMAEVIYMFTCVCLFNTMVQHCYVPENLVMVFLKINKAISRDLTCIEVSHFHQLLLKVRQFGFKKHSGCCHALFTYGLLRRVR